MDKINVRNVNAVSYTHLDVYKRQVSTFWPVINVVVTQELLVFWNILVSKVSEVVSGPSFISYYLYNYTESMGAGAMDEQCLTYTRSENLKSHI